MILKSVRFALLLTVTAWFSIPASATPIADCNASFTACAIPENVLLQLPFLGIAGDVIVQEANSTAVSDVFRIFNNFVNTGGGTGLGDLAFLYSADDIVLPVPSSYSLNVITIKESDTGPTFFNGNGTIYTLNTPEPSSFGLLGLGLFTLLFAAKKRFPKGFPAAPTNLVGIALLSCVAVHAQEPLAIDPLSPTSARSGRMVGLGPSLPETTDAASATSLAFFRANYNSLGTSVQLPFNIVGTDPANGAATTTIPTVIVPIKIVYQAAGGLTLDGTTVVPAVQNSPIFLTADYTVGGTDLGVTQYGDALQRAEFWQIPGFSQDYHVLLGQPTIAPTVTITVANSTQGNLYRLRSGSLIGVVTGSFFDEQLNALIPNYTANMLPIFLTDNVFEGDDGTISTCCILGYHNSQGPPALLAKTWIYAAYTEPGTFRNDSILDVQALSHEVAEWLNDPFVGAFSFGFLNIVPPAVLPGQGGACIVNFETGDPLEAPPAVFTEVTNGTTYHLQDEVFLPWFLHTTPSFSVNGWYSMQNTFPTYSSLCGPG